MTAHAGVEGNILADAAAKQVVTQKIIDAGGKLMTFQMRIWQQLPLTLDVMSAIMRMSTMSGLCILSPSMKAWT